MAPDRGNVAGVVAPSLDLAGEASAGVVATSRACIHANMRA